MILMKGATKQVEVPKKVQGLLPAALDHTVIEGVVLPDEEGPPEPPPDWLEKAFNQAWVLIQEAEDDIDCFMNHHANKIPRHQRKKLAALHADLEEFLKYYESEGEGA